MRSPPIVRVVPRQPAHTHRLRRGEQSVTTDFEITEALTAGCRS